MTDDTGGLNGHVAGSGDVVEIDLNFESMRRFQAEFSSNLSTDGLFIDTGEPLDPGTVVRFRVILPEGFVFLEGTAVVEWQRPAEAGADGPPGMALRFAVLSQQNQELVEQLVNDSVEAGGVPFDLDVRPRPSDFPTDALEGAPRDPVGPSTEGYRLTIRRTGPEVDVDALRALVEALPPAEGSDGSDLELGALDAEEAVRVGFQAEAQLSESAFDGIGDPPDLDWSDTMDDRSGVEAGERVRGEGDDRLRNSGARSGFEEAGREPVRGEYELLPVPSDFEDGPEVIAEVDRHGVDQDGSSFEVSLPNDDDEVDSTPVLRSESRDDGVVVPPDEGDSGSRRPRRLWPWGIVLVFVLAVAGGLLWPRAAARFAGRGGPADPLAMASADREAASPVVAVAEVPISEPAVVQEGVTEDGVADRNEPDGAVAGEPRPAAADTDRGAVASPSAADDRVTAPPPGPPANAVTAIELDGSSGGTRVEIRGNGSVEAGVVSLETLSSPPRVLVRLRGIEAAFRPYTLEPNTTEVQRARIGHHADRRPPELWVVLDLAEDGVVVQDLEVRGDLVRFFVVHP